jgi:hypothetical protein
LYRGVGTDHPGYAEALQGGASPIGGHSDPILHNYITSALMIAYSHRGRRTWQLLRDSPHRRPAAALCSRKSFR